MASSGEDKKSFHQFISDFLIVGLLLTIATSFYGISHFRDPRQAIVISSLLALFSSILGGRFTALWRQFGKQGSLVFRSRITIRSSGLFLRNLERFEYRISEMLKRHSSKAPSKHVTRAHLEEMILSCRAIREEGFASIDTWSDLLPEVNGRAQLAEIDSLRAKLVQTQGVLQETKSELESTREKIEEQKKISAIIDQKQLLKESLEDRLMERAVEYDYSLLGGLYPATQQFSMVRNVSGIDRSSTKTEFTFHDVLSEVMLEDEWPVKRQSRSSNHGLHPIEKETIKKALIVQSDATSREQLSQMIEDLGYDVTQCNNGQDALEIATSETFEIILVDVIIPKIRGFDLISKLRSKGVQSKFLVVTGYSSKEQFAHAKENLIQKPVNRESLIKAIQKSLLDNSHLEA